MGKFEIQIDTMKALTIRKKLSDYIQTVNEEKLRAIYTLLENDIENNGRISLEQYNIELEEAEVDFINGDYISNLEMTSRIKQW